MKVNRIALTNLRSHRQFAIEDIPKILLITGRNAAGKSSILDGLSWALTGATKYTNAAGAGATTLIMDGEGRALAEVDITTESGPHTIKRSIPHLLSVDGSKGGVKRAEELLNVLMSPLNQEQLYITLNAERILHSMSDNERRKFLSDVVGVSRRTDEEKHQDFVAWLVTKGIPATSPNAMGAIAMLQDPAQKKDYQTFYGMRRDANVVIAALSGRINARGPIEPVPENVEETIPKVYTRLAMIGLELKLAERSEDKPDMAAIITKPDIEKIQAKVDNLRVILAAAREASASKEQRVALYDSQKHQVQSAAKQCPVFLRQCPLAPAEIAEAIAATDTFKDRESRELKVEKKKASAAEVALATAIEELDKAKKDMEQYKELWAGDHITFDRVRAKAEIMLEQAQLHDRIKTLEDQKLKAAILETNAQHQRDLDATKARLGPLELLVEAFSPAGMSSMLLTDHLARLETLATTTSRIVTRNRYEITFSAVDGELDISVISGGRKRPIQSLSTSEVVWVSFVLQHVINQFIGSRTLVLDEASVLDVGMVEGLQDFLLQPDLPYDNVIVCATTEDENFLPRLTQDVRRVRL